jgi:hypothetical protein
MVLFRPLFWNARSGKPSHSGVYRDDDSSSSLLLNLLPAVEEKEAVAIRRFRPYSLINLPGIAPIRYRLPRNCLSPLSSGMMTISTLSGLSPEEA